MDNYEFSVDLPSEISGMTLYGPDGVIAAFRRNEAGEIVEVDAEDAVIGVAIDAELRSRWLTIRDAENEPAPPPE